ncbi:MAG TPA: amino acid permease, partial [Pyrinomonadaceae bacterium]
PVADWLVAAVALALLTVVNCLGVRAGGSVQSVLRVLKIVAVVALIVLGLLWARGPALAEAALLDRPASLGLVAALGAALTPVMFAYGGWQTASFVSGEMRAPRRDLPRGLLLGVCGVILLYTLVNVAALRALGAEGLAATTTPASAVMRLVLGETGAALIAVGIAVSTLGFLSQSMLTAPRVYFAMAEDGLFFRAVGRLSGRTRAPVAAIALQGAAAAVIAVSGRYEQILNYVVSVDFIWFGLTAVSLFVFRRKGEGRGAHGFRVPGHPFTTALFAAACALIVAATVAAAPVNSAVGFAILATGVPAYLLWRGRARV